MDMIDRLITQLDKLFPLYPIPDPDGLQFPHDWEGREACAILSGKTWKQVRIDELRLQWNVVSWLDAASFLYYLPSVMLRSLQELKAASRITAMELPVDSVFYYITREDVFDEKWRSFSYEQLRLVRIWHALLLKREQDPETAFHRKNMEALMRRLFPDKRDD